MTVADIKSAYLVAFAIFGYSWVTAGRLSPIRAAFVGNVPPDWRDAVETCGLINEPSLGRTVIEVTAPVPLTLVVGPEAKLVIALPSPDTPDVMAACERIQGISVQCRSYGWPLMVRETQRALGLDAAEFFKPEDAWDHRGTFHLDRCHATHRGSVNPLRDVTRAVNFGLASGRR